MQKSFLEKSAIMYKGEKKGGDVPAVVHRVYVDKTWVTTIELSARTWQRLQTAARVCGYPTGATCMLLNRLLPLVLHPRVFGALLPALQVDPCRACDRKGKSAL